MKKGLNRQLLVAEAVRMVEEKGYSSFSLRDLAAGLGVKPASLYNHIKGIEDINLGIMETVSTRLINRLNVAIEGKNPDAAFIDSAVAYRAFAEENRNLYDAFVTIPKTNRAPYLEVAFGSFAPIRQLIHTYSHTREDLITLEITLVSFLHGNIEMTAGVGVGGMSVNDDLMFLRIIHGFLNILKGAEDFKLPYWEQIKEKRCERKDENK